MRISDWSSDVCSSDLCGALAMRYLSTRGDAPVLSFDEVLLAGLARDGGLYLPETWPQFTPGEIRGLAGRSYAEIAFAVIRPFVHEIGRATWRGRVCQ